MLHLDEQQCNVIGLVHNNKKNFKHSFYCFVERFLCAGFQEIQSRENLFTETTGPGSLTFTALAIRSISSSATKDKFDIPTLLVIHFVTEVHVGFVNPFDPHDQENLDYPVSLWMLLH